MPIFDALQILGLVGLSAALFYAGISKRIVIYSGRRGRGGPLKHGQRRFEGLLWGSAVLTGAVLKTLGTLGKISEEVWDSLHAIVFVGAVVSTMIMTLVNPRIRAKRKDSGYAGFFYWVLWVLVLVGLLMVMSNIWILLRLLTDRFVL